MEKEKNDEIIVSYYHRLKQMRERIHLPFDINRDIKLQLVEACNPYWFEADVEASVFSFNSISNTWMEMCVYYADEKRFLKL